MFMGSKYELEKFKSYLKNERNYSTHTLTSYLADVSTFMAFSEEVFELKKASQITYLMIREWIVHLSENKVSPRSINRKISSLRNFFMFLQKEEVIEINPIAKHKSIKVTKKIHPPISEDEIKKVLALLNEQKDFESLRNLIIIELLYTTGIRRTELIELKDTNISLSTQSIKVIGKRNKERIIPLLESTIEKINAYIKSRDQLLQIDVDYFFVTNKGKKIYPNLVYRVVTYYLAKFSVKEKISPHILRHSFATHLLSNGAELNAVKELLGHASLSSTQIYTHNNPSMLKKTYFAAHPRSLSAED